MSTYRLTALSFRAASIAGFRRSVTQSSNGQMRLEPLTTTWCRRHCAAQPAPSRPPSPTEAPRTEPKPQPAQVSAKREVEEKVTEKGTESGTDSSPRIPDIPSNSWTSIGFEPQDANDPNKWKKFAWKYVGAVLLFFVSYKTLHWYVDRIEEEGKQRKKGLEETREFSNELKSGGNSSAGVSSMFQNTVEQNADFKRMMDEQQSSIQTSSELDELYRYRDELDSRLRELRKQGRTPEIDAEKKEVKLELRSLAGEISTLERKKKS
ncbi:hypothetical protein FGB62_13g128 [Gracilaria domingensis]|nr:hypothetical protein FGB62_13g128 [Gracilaria domingensis]